MKEKFIRIKDKICAICTILWCKEFALFTCQYFEKADYSTCTLSVEVEDKKKSKIFRETIANFIKQF
jgi:hypothetical protein